MIGRRAPLRLACTAALLLALPAAAEAQNPNKPDKPESVSIAAQPNPVVFGSPVSVSGDVKGAGAGVVVTLLRRPATGGDFAPAGTATTDNAGRYALTDRPAVNVVYRVRTATSPPLQSTDLLVRVRMLVGSRVSDTTPLRGALVRFSGIVRPAHDGRLAYIQKRSSAGSWITVARTTLRALDAATSRYSRWIRVRSTGDYRVRVLGHADHAMGISRVRTLTVR